MAGIGNKRYTIAFFIEGSSGFGGFQDIVWSNMVKAAEKNDVNLLVFAGGAIDNAPYNPYEKNLNFIYDLVKKEYIDGIIINCTIKNYITKEQFNEFKNKFNDIPILSIIGPIENLPDVHVDNKNGMKEVMDHMIGHHNYRHLAFIKGTEGNPDAEERLEVYKKVLAEHNIKFDQDLVYNGTFDEISGVHAVNYFIKEKNKKIDAIIASNDAMAFGAINELRKLNIKIPGDITVTGFDDTDEAGAFNPSLTTVRQPFNDMGCRAIEKLIEIIEGNKIRESISVPARLVKRQSCGCFSTDIEEAVINENDIRIKEPEHHENIVDEIVKDLTVSPLEKEKVMSMFKSFIYDMENSTGKFLAELKEYLQNSIIFGKEITIWQNVISMIRKHVFKEWNDKKILFDAENLINQSRILISEMSEQAQAYKKIINERQAKALRDVGQSLITTFNFDQLKSLLKVQLPKLGIKSYHISILEDINSDTGKSRTFIQYNDDTSKITSSEVFAEHGMPSNLFQKTKRYTMAVHALTFKNFKLGFAIFELGPEEGFVYDTLQVQISSSLMGSELLYQRDNTESILKQRSNRIQKLVIPMIESIKNITGKTKEKIDIINNLIDLTKENRQKVTSTNQSIEKMGEKFYKMLDIINVINDISGAVNVLAINTSIEAAHAGQYGKGFSVIAGEIRKLSDSIKHNTNEISSLLSDIKSNIDETKKAGNDSQEAFFRLEKDVIEVANTLQEITVSLENLSEKSSQILSVMNG